MASVVTKIQQHTKNVFFANLQNIRSTFDGFTLDGYCCVAAVILLFGNVGARGQGPD